MMLTVWLPLLNWLELNRMLTSCSYTNTTIQPHTYWDYAGHSVYNNNFPIKMLQTQIELTSSHALVTMPQTMWFTDCRVWTYLIYICSNHCSPSREEVGLWTNTSITLRHIKVSVQGKTMYVLVQDQQGHWMTSRSMTHMSEASIWGTKAAIAADTTTWVTLQLLGSDFMMFDGSEYLVIVN